MRRRGDKPTDIEGDGNGAAEEVIYLFHYDAHLSPECRLDVLPGMENSQDEYAVIRDLIDNQVIFKAMRFPKSKLNILKAEEVHCRATARARRDLVNTLAHRVLKSQRLSWL